MVAKANYLRIQTRLQVQITYWRGKDKNVPANNQEKNFTCFSNEANQTLEEYPSDQLQIFAIYSRGDMQGFLT